MIIGITQTRHIGALAITDSAEVELSPLESTDKALEILRRIRASWDAPIPEEPKPRPHPNFFTYEFKEGDDFPGRKELSSYPIAGIHVREGHKTWGNRIECYGKTDGEATRLRNAVLSALKVAKDESRDH